MALNPVCYDNGAVCGIAGIVSTKLVQDSTISALLKTLRHRGPDDEGTYLNPDRTVGLAHTRLSILDLSVAGHQPMSNEDGTLWIVYNGEVYNYRELRQELVAQAGPWKSDTDTEVILKAYARWGLEAFRRFRGMFAFGIWDGLKKRLVLARDPFGIKPLYYSILPDGILFASEVRTLLESGWISRRLSLEGLASYLSFGSVEDPLTLLSNVRSLSPGQVLIAESHPEAVRIRTERLAGFAPDFKGASQPDTMDFPKGRRQSAGRLKEVLKEAVRAHLVSDVPLGAFLSGGIDSSAIVALLSQVSRQRPRTFSVVFKEPEFSEARYAQAVAKKCQTLHQEILLTEGDLLRLLPNALAAMDQPTMNGVNSYVISKAVKEAGITVALSGLGGDELFGGYPSFARARSARRMKLLPGWSQHGLARMIRGLAAGSPRMEKGLDLLDSRLNPQEIYAISRRLFSFKEIVSLLETPPSAPAYPFPEVPPNADPFTSICLYELGHYMVNTLLRDTDFMSMTHALEVRVPFVDREVVQAVLSIPSEHKVNGQGPKPLLWEAVREWLPEEIWRRPKQGFTFPFERWMGSQLRPQMEATFSDETPWKALGLRSASAQKLWEAFLRSPRRIGWSRPWALYVLARWTQFHRITL